MTNGKNIVYKPQRIGIVLFLNLYQLFDHLIRISPSVAQSIYSTTAPFTCIGTPTHRADRNCIFTMMLFPGIQILIKIYFFSVWNREVIQILDLLTFWILNKIIIVQKRDSGNRFPRCGIGLARGIIIHIGWNKDKAINKLGHGFFAFADYNVIST